MTDDYGDRVITKKARFISWMFQFLAIIILFQTLYFKFTGAKESIYIFESLGIEPWGRYISGIVELMAGLFMLIPRYSWIGAFLGLTVISTALYFHIARLGIEIMGDGGAMFYLAVTVCVSCLAILWIRRKEAIVTLKNWSA